MATLPENLLAAFPDISWQNQSSTKRLRFVQKLGQDGDGGQEALLYIAQNDEELGVRSRAVEFISQLSTLQSMRAEPGFLQGAFVHQFYRVLSGSFNSNATEAERLTIIKQLDAAALKQIALLSKCKAAGSEALLAIEEPADIADLCLFAASVHVRKNAALKLTDHTLIKEIALKIEGKDKTVHKILEKLLQEPSKPNVASVKKLADTKAEVKQKKTSESVAQPKIKKVNTRGPAKIKNPEQELLKLTAELNKLSPKNTDKLHALKISINRLSQLEESELKTLQGKVQTLQKDLQVKLDRNLNHQKQLEENTLALLETLKQALDNGQSHDALPAWDKIQGNISNTQGKLRSTLLALTNVYKAKLDELRDWKSFAATEKKKELITQMQHLLDSKMHAGDRSKHIGDLHHKWKALGRSNQNEELWRKFKKISDHAYEPCKAYFKQRKQDMAENLKKRREICTRLEADLEIIAKENVNISNINKLLSQSEKEWKIYSPVDQSKIKALQKNYYGAVNKLRRLRRNSLKQNGKEKQDLINQAQDLTNLEDNKKAMEEAKRLQQEWKKHGPTSYKEDKKYWDNFRAACDKIFEKRTQQSAKIQDDIKSAEKNLEGILKSLGNTLELKDEEFREARKDFNSLVQEFAASLDPRIKKQRSRWLDQFNGVKRNIEQRFKALPDKKHLKLKNLILAKANFCSALESKLLSSKNDENLNQVSAQFDKEAWKGLETSGNIAYEKVMEERVQEVSKAKSLQTLKTIVKDSESKLKALCIELEIRANIESPKEDQSHRMQIQLDQLKNGFGQSKPSREENVKYAFDAELKSLCLGPITADAQKPLYDRISKAINKLI
jgi:hypothetical protein